MHPYTRETCSLKLSSSFMSSIVAVIRLDVLGENYGMQLLFVVFGPGISGNHVLIIAIMMACSGFRYCLCTVMDQSHEGLYEQDVLSSWY